MRVRGSTLLEVVLTVALAATMLFSAVIFYSMILEARTDTRSIAEVEQQGLHAMEIIAAVIRGAESVTTPIIGSGASVLTLDVVDAGKDPTAIDLSGGSLRITEGAGTPVVLTSSRVTASSLTFSNYSRASTPGTIRIQFTLTYASQNGGHEYTYTKTFVGSASLRHP